MKREEGKVLSTGYKLISHKSETKTTPFLI